MDMGLKLFDCSNRIYEHGITAISVINKINGSSLYPQKRLNFTNLLRVEDTPCFLNWNQTVGNIQQHFNSSPLPQQLCYHPFRSRSSGAIPHISIMDLLAMGVWSYYMLVCVGSRSFPYLVAQNGRVCWHCRFRYSFLQGNCSSNKISSDNICPKPLFLFLTIYFVI